MALNLEALLNKVEASDKPDEAFIDAICALARQSVADAFAEALADGVAGPALYERLNEVTTTNVDALRITLAALGGRSKEYAERAEEALIAAAEHESKIIAMGSAQWGHA